MSCTDRNLEKKRKGPSGRTYTHFLPGTDRSLELHAEKDDRSLEFRP